MPEVRQRQSDAGATHEATATAEVQRGKRTLWLNNEVSAPFDLEHVPTLLASGWTLVPPDPRTLATEVQHALDRLSRAVGSWVDGVIEDGQIDPSDDAQLAVVHAAFRDVNQTFESLYGIVGRGFPVRETGETVEMVEHRWEAGESPEEARRVRVEGPDGEPVVHRVPKEQVEEYRQRHGWTVRRGGMED
jgi:hypothetical protein